MQKENELIDGPTFKPKSLLRNKDGKKEKKKKSVVWDTKTLQEQEIERKLHPVTMKIDEPKTPYHEYQGDDEYLKKINSINKVEYSDDLMSQVMSKLESKGLDDQNEYLEVEIIDKDGQTRKELVKKEHVNTKEFLKKRHFAYANEFTEAKKKFDQKDLEDEEMDEQKKFEEQVINNTLFNKFAGKMGKTENEGDKKEDA